MSEPPLPGLLDEIATLAGRERALALAAARGGTRFTVPKAVRADHWLVDLIGLEAAQHLAAGRGGELILVPIGPTALAAGHSIETTAKLANVHARTVYRHKRRLRPVAEARAG